MSEPRGVPTPEPPRRTARPSRLLAILRLPMVAGWTAVCGSVAVLAYLLRKPAPGVSAGIRNLTVRAWGKGFLWILGVQVEVRGTPPHPPFLLVTNHLSYIDIPLLASLTRCVFVSKHEVRGWPGFGLAARAAGTIFIDRSRKRDAVRVLDQMEEARKAGDGIIFFPEGTSTRGERVTPLKPALLDAAIRSGQPIHYGVISYRTPPDQPPAHEVVCWWGDMTFFPHFFTLLGIPGFTAFVTFGHETLMDEDRKALAARLHRVLDREFIPVVPREATE